MRERQKTSPWIFVAAVFAVIVVGAIVAFALFQKTPAPPQAARSNAESSPPAFSQAPQTNETAQPAQNESETSAQTSPSAPVFPAWEKRIDDVLRNSANTNATQTAQILLNILPTLPPEGQAAAANHIVNLLPDSDYAAAKPMLLNPSLSKPALDVFFTDLMKRGDTTKLPMFLEVAKIPNHPFREQARGALQIFVGSDFGDDWTKWNAAVEQYLDAQPQQPQPQ